MSLERSVLAWLESVKAEAEPLRGKRRGPSPSKHPAAKRRRTAEAALPSPNASFGPAPTNEPILTPINDDDDEHMASFSNPRQQHGTPSNKGVRDAGDDDVDDTPRQPAMPLRTHASKSSASVSASGASSEGGRSSRPSSGKLSVGRQLTRMAILDEGGGNRRHFYGQRYR